MTSMLTSPASSWDPVRPAVPGIIVPPYRYGTGIIVPYRYGKGIPVIVHRTGTVQV
jgi:hypothetical protein